MCIYMYTLNYITLHSACVLYIDIKASFFHQHKLWAMIGGENYDDSAQDDGKTATVTTTPIFNCFDFTMSSFMPHSLVAFHLHGKINLLGWQ